jgi:hypothetical protein
MNEVKSRKEKLERLNSESEFGVQALACRVGTVLQPEGLNSELECRPNDA